ncbi:hypothetical protein PAECIP111893_04044 [Paenibacillus plantiphilus]|uniref:Uncharacterized protein n=1 Tax=Paenibacillus plantiphilus TaxID=2905650 RepID=A0ABM9CLG6_9BACL|nr:hypothetical protein PAECIP111893_04044 [Paenibacillus plantiphilus]
MQPYRTFSIVLGGVLWFCTATVKPRSYIKIIAAMSIAVTSRYCFILAAVLRLSIKIP